MVECEGGDQSPRMDPDLGGGQRPDDLMTAALNRRSR
jgi:hypothetical protein